MNKIFQNITGSFKYIRVIGLSETYDIFKVVARTDIFLYKKGKKGEKTRYIDEYGEEGEYILDIEKNIPNFGMSIIEKIRKRGVINELDVIKKAEVVLSDCKKSKLSKKGKYKIIHLITKEGRRVYKRKEKHTYQDIPKIIINALGGTYIYYDKDGNYGTTASQIIIPNPTNKMVKFYESELFQFILYAFRMTGLNILPYMFEDIPKDYGEGLELNKKEEELIKRFSVPTYKDKDIIEVCKNKTLKNKLIKNKTLKVIK